MTMTFSTFYRSFAMKPDRTIREALEATGLPFKVVQGKKHLKYFLQDRMVCVCSRSAKADRGPRGLENVLADIRRAARQLKGEQPRG